MLLLPGEILSKRYRIVSLLGSGPFGAVYRAWDTVDRIEVAVKEHRSGEPDAARRFRQDGAQLAGLKHDQLPAVRDYFSLEEGTLHYLISDFVDGVSLAELLAQYGPLPADLIADYLEAAAVPLAYLHEKKRLHLNLKPANIRVTPDGRVFLVDSGLPGLGVPAGPAGYVPPEQEKQSSVDERADVYALGATLYTLLTGKAPPGALKREIGLDLTTPAREINPDAPPYLSILASRAMSLAPEQRPATIVEFARGLRRPNSRGLEDASLAIERDKFHEARRTPHPDPRPTPPPHRRPARQGRQIQTRTIWGLSLLLVMLVLTILAYTALNREELVGGSEAAATATIESQVIAALTAVAPTVTPTPPPTPQPTPTPAPIISKTGMRMLYVPGGVFRFGNDDGDPDEGPSQLVNLDPFFIDETEVTNRQYAQCVDDGVCAPPAQRSASYHPAYYGSADFDNYPVVFVTWYQAEAFCRWRDTRLPTEAEWERSAGYNPQSLQRTTYPWGDEFNGELLNYCDVNCPREGRDETANDGHQDTAPVGSYPDGRSYIGAADMMGNVMEWVNDWYGRDYYAEAPNLNPRGPAEGEFKVLRGGSWFTRQDELSTTTRGFFDPTVSRATLGFRCAMNIP